MSLSTSTSSSSSCIWKYAVRLDEGVTTTKCLANMLDFWNQGPLAFVTEYCSSSSPTNNASSSTTNTDELQKHVAGAYRSPIPANYVIFSCADGQRYLVSNSVARMCDSLAELLDDLDLQNGDVDFEESNKNVLVSSDNNEIVENLIEDCALLEVAITSSALEAIVVYLATAIERGSTSTIPYPLTGVLTNSLSSSINNDPSVNTASAQSTSTPNAEALQQVVQPWEMKFLEQYAPHVSSGQIASSATTTTPQTRPVAFAPVNIPNLIAQQSSNTKNSSMFCPPLINLLRAADYLGINSLRDLTSAYLALKLLSTRDEAALAATLGLAKLPAEKELEDVYSRFPFLAPTRYAVNSGSGNNNQGAASSASRTGSVSAVGGGGVGNSSHAPISP